MDQTIRVIEPVILHHPWLEQASWVVQIALALIAAITAIAAMIQLRHIRHESLDRTEQLKLLRDEGIARNDQMKGSFLFELDKMWESESFAKARMSFNTLYNSIETYVIQNSSHLGGEDRQEAIADEFAKRLHCLKQDDTEKYLPFIKICGFFETAGLLVARKYINQRDISDLYGGSIVRIHKAMEVHIRKEGEGMPDGLFEHFNSLVRSIRIE